MAVAAGLAKGHGRRRRRHKRAGAMNEINMTPFIDVMLVLLIIFMVAAPLMTVGVPLDLPKTSAAPLNVDAKPITLSIRQTGQVFLGEAEVRDEDIVPRLTATATQGLEERVFVRGDKREPGVWVSGAAHAVLLAAGLFAMTTSSFPPADEGIPVEVITDNQFSEI